jgi:hypothetical protein
MWNGTATVPIGLNGPEHTGSAGYQNILLSFHSALGVVAGLSARVTGVNGSNGFDSWVSDGTTTVQTNLVGSEYQTPIGGRACANVAQNNSGQVVGFSTRYKPNSSATNGRDTWIWNGTATVLTGLTDSQHTSSLGFRSSTCGVINAQGAAAGYTLRDSGGQDVWYYDPTTGVSSLVVSSVRASDNFATSSVRYLTDDGVLYGVYSYYGDGSGQQRAFAYRPGLGFIDLNDLVAGGLATAGWTTLTETNLVNSTHTVIGKGGRIAPGGTPMFLLIHSLCRADYDSNGALNLQDVFTFLNDWFAGRAIADFNGGGLAVQDIFAFLDSWFAGCP